MLNIEVRPCPFAESEWKQIRFPRSKKGRIRRKWSRQRKNFGMVPKMTAYMVGGVVYAHPDVIPKLKRAMKRKEM